MRSAAPRRYPSTPSMGKRSAHLPPSSTNPGTRSAGKQRVHYCERRIGLTQLAIGSGGATRQGPTRSNEQPRLQRTTCLGLVLAGARPSLRWLRSTFQASDATSSLPGTDWQHTPPKAAYASHACARISWPLVRRSNPRGCQDVRPPHRWATCSHRAANFPTPPKPQPQMSSRAPGRRHVHGSKAYAMPFGHRPGRHAYGQSASDADIWVIIQVRNDTNRAAWPSRGPRHHKRMRQGVSLIRAIGGMGPDKGRSVITTRTTTEVPSGRQVADSGWDVEAMAAHSSVPNTNDSWCPLPSNMRAPYPTRTNRRRRQRALPLSSAAHHSCAQACRRAQDPHRPQVLPLAR